MKRAVSTSLSENNFFAERIFADVAHVGRRTRADAVVLPGDAVFVVARRTMAVSDHFEVFDGSTNFHLSIAVKINRKRGKSREGDR